MELKGGWAKICRCVVRSPVRQTWKGGYIPLSKHIWGAWSRHVPGLEGDRDGVYQGQLSVSSQFSWPDKPYHSEPFAKMGGLWFCSGSALCPPQSRPACSC